MQIKLECRDFNKNILLKIIYTVNLYKNIHNLLEAS